MPIESEIKLTQFSRGAGCGCKISPKVLDEILGNGSKQNYFKELLVGNETKDDAAVYDLGNGNALISTTDFFSPIVNDSFLFGQIASVNALSDIYAMGGKPIFALAILGWPINKIPVKLAQQVISGARNICDSIQIPLAGGHSIDTVEPIFGLAVNGIAPIKNIKKNSTAKIGDSIFLTKKIGIGILSTAEKNGIILDEDKNLSHKSMLTLNLAGEKFGALNYVSSMTDVTGFGLAGHLIEMCESSRTSATIYKSQIPIICDLSNYIEKNSIPGGTKRNLDSYGNNISEVAENWKYIIADPQTSGGLLVTIDKNFENEFLNLVASLNKDKVTTNAYKIGEITSSTAKRINVI